MNEDFEPTPRDANGSWPNCPQFEGDCLLHLIGQALGPEIMESLVTFILTPLPGSRLSLQRNQNEFTSQITGPVAHSSGTSVGLSEYRALQRKLSPSNRP